MEHKQEIKICQNCKKDFTIEPEDFNFYEKIKVPAPTWCWSCRMARRMSFRNERSLFKRKCNVEGHDEELISAYPKGNGVIYDQKYWWGDDWNPMDFSLDIDYRVPLLQQFKDLFKKVPRSNIVAKNNLNCEYVNWVDESKNCYLAFGGGYGEDILYSNRMFHSKNCLDVYFIDKLELCYENVNCQGSYSLFFAENCVNCVNSTMMYDCRNCQDCFACAGLRNKQYHIFNQPHTREEYLKKLKEFNLGSFKNLIKAKEKFERIKLSTPRKYVSFERIINSTGDFMTGTKNSEYIFDCVGGENQDSKFGFWVGNGMKDMYDGIGCGLGAELVYENVSVALSVSRIFFSAQIRESKDIYYCIECHASSDLFACVGLRSKKYCILNKQYTKEEYKKLLPKLIEHMSEMPFIDQKGKVYKYGEFFPPEFSGFAYNETIAQEYFPLTKEKAKEQGFLWKDKENRNYKIEIKNEELPDHIKDVDESIVNKAIECSHGGDCDEQCTEAFKIVPKELEFYKRMNIPLPRLCSNCRHYRRLRQRNPLNLWHRKCMCDKNNHNHQGGCPNEFETTYSPERPEIVYCEKCYHQEVY